MHSTVWTRRCSSSPSRMAISLLRMIEQEKQNDSNVFKNLEAFLICPWKWFRKKDLSIMGEWISEVASRVCHNSSDA